MEGQDGTDEPEGGGSWTCEACGCHTNTAENQSCSICGTRRDAGVLRRGGPSAASRFFARAYAVRRGMMNMDDSFDDDPFPDWNRMEEDMVVADDEQQAAAALALEVAGIRGSARIPGALTARRQRAPQRAEPQRDLPPAAELLQAARANVSLYRELNWASESQLGGRLRGVTNFELGPGGLKNVAHVPIGVGDGRAVRALTPFPRRSAGNSAAGEGASETLPKVFGFKVAFHCPRLRVGENMGGCYLLGVTSSSFTAYGDRNGLQQSPYFWGIDDSGVKFEGHSSASRARMRGSSSPFGVPMSRTEAPRNASDTVFGSDEVMTVVADLDNQTLTYWRGDLLLGTLVTSLPRTGPLYPVAVPFNSGTSVAITDLNGDPLPCLNHFESYSRQIQQEIAAQRRNKLSARRNVLIQDGKLTENLVAVLKSIFASYAGEDGFASSENLQLNIFEAARLWYRFGLKFQPLSELIESKCSDGSHYHEKKVNFDEFIGSINEIVREGESIISSEVGNFNRGESEGDFKIGDFVELTDDFSKYGDASSGPMRPGDRAMVVEVKDEGFQERQIRIVYHGKYWWYLSYALLPERSGLVDSAAVWFLRNGLRAHGYDALTLDTMWGKPVTSTSWEVGDIVVPRTNIEKTSSRESSAFALVSSSCFGRIVAHPPSDAQNTPRRGRDSGMVYVEFTDTSFGVATGVFSPSREEASPSLNVRPVRVNKLMHTCAYFDESSNDRMEDTDAEMCCTSALSTILKEDLSSLSLLESDAIQSLAVECRKSIASLASLFEAGLANSVLAAVDHAERSILESGRDVAPALTSLNVLVSAIAERLCARDGPLKTSEAPRKRAPSGSGIQCGMPVSQNNRSSRNDHRNSTDPSSSRHRRNMLLRLMSRRQGNSSGSRPPDSLNTRDNGSSSNQRAVARGLPPSLAESYNRHEDLPPLLSFVRADDPLLHEGNSSGNSLLADVLPENEMPPIEIPSAGILLSLVRGRTVTELPSCPDVLDSSATRGAVANGLLLNNLTWLENCLLSGRKEAPRQTRADNGNACRYGDEDGMPLLLLAVHLGCSVDLIRFLIQAGASAGPQEINAAAMTNQLCLLSHLFQHTINLDGIVDTKRWPSGAIKVYEKAVSRRRMQEESVINEGSDFISALVQRLCRLGLSCHRHQSAEAEQCRRAVHEALVGNVLLRVMTEAQDSVRLQAAHASTHEEDEQDLSTSEIERMSVTKYESSLGLSSWKSRGVLRSIPDRSLFSLLMRDGGDGKEPAFMTVFSFVEASLWSKESTESAFGLTSLVVLLRRVPMLRLHPDFTRFRFCELVESHQDLAKLRLAEIESRRCQPHSGGSDARSSSAGPISNVPGVVYCRRNHAAELHLTRHSSFRCDICGKGVDRGQPMYGCRSCDWDACEACTDKSEGGMTKWSSILELASECSGLLSTKYCDCDQDDNVLQDLQIEDVLGRIARSHRRCDIQSLACRIRLREIGALDELKQLLKSHDLITMSEFASLVLPSLHVSIVPNHGDSLRHSAVTPGTPTRRTKKQRLCGSFRAVEACSDDYPDAKPHERDPFCRRLVSEFLSLESTKQTNVGTALNDSSESHGTIDERSVSPPPTRVPELLYRIRQVLSFAERTSVFDTSCVQKNRRSRVESGLQSLTEAFLFDFLPTPAVAEKNRGGEALCTSRILAEPVTPLLELEKHLLRACRIDDHSYLEYCKRLAFNQDIIVERRVDRGTHGWRVARVVGYDECTGSHTIRYASAVTRGLDESGVLFLRQNGFSMDDCFEFAGPETALVLAAREYHLFRRQCGRLEEHMEDAMETDLIYDTDEGTNGDCSSTVEQLSRMRRRAETTCGSSDGSWLPCTILSENREQTSESTSNRDSSLENVSETFDIITDAGEVFRKCQKNQIRTQSSGNQRSISRLVGNASGSQDAIAPNNLLVRSMFPFLGVSRRGLDGSSGDQDRDEASSEMQVGVLKRSWSAISPLQELSALDLNISGSSKCAPSRPQERRFNCSFGELDITTFVENELLEKQPRLEVRFSAHEQFEPICFPNSSEETAFSAICQLLRRNIGCKQPLSAELRREMKLYYSFKWAKGIVDTDTKKQQLMEVTSPDHADPDELCISVQSQVSVCEGLGFASKTSDFVNLCDGLDRTCMQCMETLNELCKLSEECKAVSDTVESDTSIDTGFSRNMFYSEALTEKLIEQLDDSLAVVAGALPDWTLVAPAFAPRVFSYESRRLLLQRTAFGVSRAALKQQDSKVAVASLRQRMAALRGRAVELVGEAFSGGAEDPTALQLQADELYGMEEALAARVNAAFRAQRWRERSLQCVKVAVRRESLLADAATVMDIYANDKSMRHRRLEIRFDGESGFDSSSGNEAGVTRGFYADVAEALLSTDHVSSLHCMLSCPGVLSQFGVGSMAIEDSRKPSASFSNTKLPLWIPDMDSSRQVIIPTPRADPRSSLGLFPRPLSQFDPFLDAVRDRFRFMGRLFAAAMRDGFMFPLPLSCAFLRLVQAGGVSSEIPSPSPVYGIVERRQQLPPSAGLKSSFPSNLDRNPSVDDMSISDHSTVAGAGCTDCCLSPVAQNTEQTSTTRVLKSQDLPRPGFLGGEVYAVETFVCEALAKLESSDIPMTKAELEKCRNSIASDPKFARVALGKSFDCSFEDYFQDRTFVDPLDPSQGVDAHPLCPNGHLRQVTIENVQEWVVLAKQFILHDGVIEQALAFRQGVEDFFPADYLSIFTPEELQRDVCGGGDNVDVWDEEKIRSLFKLDGGTEALVAVAAIGGEGGASLSRRFGPSSPTIEHLVKTLLESNATQRRQFLSFVTSVPIVTPGKIEVVPIVSPTGEFMPMQDPSCMPRANTCARRLYLPRFDNYETFARVLHAVIREESRFKGFYEWRGS